MLKRCEMNWLKRESISHSKRYKVTPDMFDHIHGERYTLNSKESQRALGLVKFQWFHDFVTRVKRWLIRFR